MDFFLLVIWLVLQSGDTVTGQGCLRALNRDDDPNDPPFNDDNADPLPANNAVQAIVSTYQFYCDCVNITTWETFVQSGQENHDEGQAYDIVFQVWRPSSTVEDTGCYSLVGENAFTRVNFFDGGFVQLHPPRNEMITARSGDVIGYYSNNRIGPNNGIQLDRDYDYSNNIIWYHNIRGNEVLSSHNKYCPFAVGTGSDRVLISSTAAAPVIKVSTTTVPCPSPLFTTSLISTSVALKDTSSQEQMLESSLPPSYMSTSPLPLPYQYENSGLTVIVSSSIAAGVFMFIIILLCLLIVIKVKVKSEKQNSHKNKDEVSIHYVNSVTVSMDTLKNSGIENESGEATRTSSNCKVKSKFVPTTTNVAYGAFCQQLLKGKNHDVDDAINMHANIAYKNVETVNTTHEEDLDVYTNLAYNAIDDVNENKIIYNFFPNVAYNFMGVGKKVEAENGASSS